MALQRQQSALLAGVVRALVSAIDAKDPTTCGHSERVARYAVRLALELRLPPPMLHKVYMGGLLHDVGKIGIDDQILRNTDRLTDAEYAQIQQHPEMGARILADVPQLADVLPAVLFHHERWDGCGYPFGLAGDQIPLLARIVAVADAYDAITSDRPYRRGMEEAQAEAILRRGRGASWTPEVVDAFFRCKRDIEAIRHTSQSADR